MAIADEMRTALEAAFAPTELEIVNESSRHLGHPGDDGSGESHWAITIAAPAFATMKRVEQHRAVYQALGTGIMGRIHALALTVR